MVFKPSFLFILCCWQRIAHLFNHFLHIFFSCSKFFIFFKPKLFLNIQPNHFLAFKKGNQTIYIFYSEFRTEIWTVLFLSFCPPFLFTLSYFLPAIHFLIHLILSQYLPTSATMLGVGNVRKKTCVIHFLMELIGKCSLVLHSG